MYSCIENNGHHVGLQDKFLQMYSDEFQNFNFCDQHNTVNDIVKLNMRLTIYKYLRDKNTQNKSVSAGHFKKHKIFKDSKVHNKKFKPIKVILIM